MADEKKKIIYTIISIAGFMGEISGGGGGGIGGRDEGNGRWRWGNCGAALLRRFVGQGQIPRKTVSRGTTDSHYDAHYLGKF